MKAHLLISWLLLVVQVEGGQQVLRQQRLVAVGVQVDTVHLPGHLVAVRLPNPNHLLLLGLHTQSRLEPVVLAVRVLAVAVRAKGLTEAIRFLLQLLLLLAVEAVVVTLEHRLLLLEVETMEALAVVLAVVQEQPMQHREMGLQIKVLMAE